MRAGIESGALTLFVDHGNVGPGILERPWAADRWSGRGGGAGGHLSRAMRPGAPPILETADAGLVPRAVSSTLTCHDLSAVGRVKMNAGSRLRDSIDSSRGSLRREDVLGGGQTSVGSKLRKDGRER